MPADVQAARRHSRPAVPPTCRKTTLAAADHLQCAVDAPLGHPTVSPPSPYALGRTPEQLVNEQAHKEVHAIEYWTADSDTQRVIGLYRGKPGRKARLRADTPRTPDDARQSRTTGIGTLSNAYAYPTSPAPDSFPVNFEEPVILSGLPTNRAGRAPRLVFVNVPEARQGKNRVHPGIVPDGPQTEELAWLEALGARVIDDRRRIPSGGWVVPADPGGNESGLESAE